MGTKEKTVFDVLDGYGLTALYPKFNTACVNVNKLYTISDIKLHDMGCKIDQIDNYREHIKYTEGTWQSLLYSLNFGRYVRTLEESNIENTEEILELEVEDLQDVLN